MNEKEREDLKGLLELMFEADPRLKTNLELTIEYIDYEPEACTALLIKSVRTDLIMALITHRGDRFQWEEGHGVFKGTLIEDMHVMTQYSTAIRI